MILLLIIVMLMVMIISQFSKRDGNAVDPECHSPSLCNGDNNCAVDSNDKKSASMDKKVTIASESRSSSSKKKPKRSGIRRCKSFYELQEEERTQKDSLDLVAVLNEAGNTKS